MSDFTSSFKPYRIPSSLPLLASIFLDNVESVASKKGSTLQKKEDMVWIGW